MKESTIDRLVLPLIWVPKQRPLPDHIRNPDCNPASVDVPGAVLLGIRQLEFLDQWAQDWSDAKKKIALSQTIFCGGAHIHGSANGRLDAALASLRKAFAFHYAGDTFTPKALRGKSFLIKAGEELADTVVATDVAVGGEPKTIVLK